MSRASSTPATMTRPRPEVSGWNPAANVVRIGGRPSGLGDLYHSILTMRWSVFLALLVGSQVLANLVFAGLYALDKDSIANAKTLADLFYFSVQTWATIGYGGMSPTTHYTNLLVVAESICGIVFTAVTTGIVFAKFARPSARVLFAERAIVCMRDGKPFLMLRVANERGNDVVEANARLTLLRDMVSREGERMRRLFDLPLVRSVQPYFALSWTLMHEIDASSPFFGVSPEQIVREAWRLTVNVTGHDGTLSQTIYANAFYTADQIAFGARYVDVLTPLPGERLQLDLTRFHDVEPQPGWPGMPGTTPAA